MVLNRAPSSWLNCRLATRALSVGLLSALVACGGGGGGGGGGASTVPPAAAAPSVSLQPADATVLAPATATFTVAASGVPMPTVQWQQSPDGGTSWSDVSGAAAASYTTAATQVTDNGKQFRAVFANASGSATTAAATLTVGPAGVSLLAGDLGGRGNLDGAGSQARFNSPTGVAVDAAGNLYVADAQNNVVRKVSAAGVVTTVAGSGNFAYADGNGSSASFFLPQGIAIDANGVLYIADTQNSVIRKVTPDGTVSTLAGLAGSTGSADGAGSTARFNLPRGIAVDATGVIYVADTGNRAIREVTAGGTVSTLSGSIVASALVTPTALAVDSAGVVYVADSGLSSIELVSPSGAVSALTATVVDSGGAVSPAVFNQPSGIAIDSAGAVYVADTLNRTIRKIAPGGVTTVLAGTTGVRGNADGVGSAALWYAPRGLAIDAAGVLHVADTSNQTIRSIDASGTVTTVAGATENTGAVDGGAAEARFAPIMGLALDPAGNVFVADGTNFTVRKVTLAGDVSTFAGSPGLNGVGDSSDDGTGSAARFDIDAPNFIAADPFGDLYVDDGERVRKISSAGVVGEFAGSSFTLGTADGAGSHALFFSINGLATDASGNVYVADYGAIRKISPSGVVTTLAGAVDQTGNVDATGNAARFFALGGLVVDPSGIVYAVDTLNYSIRKVTPDGVVTTLAGAGFVGTSVDGTGSSARFVGPQAITSDGRGNLYVADGCAIRKVTTTGMVSTVLGVAGQCGIQLGSDARLYDSFALTMLGPKRLLIASHDALLVANLP
jgi:sugar lactone lactonase YvrE